MSDDPSSAKPSPPLSLEQLAQLLPGTGEIMASVGNAWWKCAYAARGGNDRDTRPPSCDAREDLAIEVLHRRRELARSRED